MFSKQLKYKNYFLSKKLFNFQDKTQIILRFIFICLVFLNNDKIFAQSKIKKIFYDQDWRVVKEPSKASFYSEFDYWFGETGTIRTFRSGGGLYSEGEYFSIPKRIRSGKLFYWYPNGQLKSRSFYQSNQLHGELVTYYPSGEIKRLEIYEEGKFRFGKCFSKEGTDTTWYPFSEPPIFPPGRENYFTEKLKYPQDAFDQGILGTVLVTCIIDTAGYPTKIRVFESIDERLDKEAIRLVSEMPKWIAGKKDGIPEPFLVVLPVHFTIENPAGTEYDGKSEEELEVQENIK